MPSIVSRQYLAKALGSLTVPVSIGNWLHRQWVATNTKKLEVELILNAVYEMGYTEDTLQNEWNAQVLEQTKPLKKQSKLWANKEIEEILVLTRNLETYKKEEIHFENMIEIGEYDDGVNVYVAQETLEDLSTKINKTKKAIEGKCAKLSVDGRLNLAKLLDNDFLKLRMNALALKQRICDCLRMRKFEIENLECAYRSTVNQTKLQKHAQQQIKKKEPGIQTLARNYNKLCNQLDTMIAQHKALRGTIASLPIVLEGLFKLDVDDDIWQDIGLSDYDYNKSIPDWLGNDDVRRGIKALLEYDRCIEEESRLIEKKISMWQWFREEWAIVIKGLELSQEDIDAVYQFQERKFFLLRLYLVWELPVRIILGQNNQNDISWGPSMEDIENAKKFEYTESVLEQTDIEIDDLDEQSDAESINYIMDCEEMDEEYNEAELMDNMEMDLLETRSNM